MNLPFNRLFVFSGTLAVLLAAAGCSNMQMGDQDAKTVATGSAAGSHTQGENPGLEKCDQIIGTMMVIEDHNSDWYVYYNQQYKLGPTAPVLKLLAQQSNCFVVVERSNRAMNSMMRERALQDSGELRKGSNFHAGQMVSADYSLSPTITFSSKNSGGIAAGISGLISSSLGRTAVGLAGSAKVQDASTLLTLIDNRSSVQLAAAEGSARNLDFGAVSSIFNRRSRGTGGVGLGGYTNSPEGKVIVAALTDAFNNMVRAVRNYEMQTIKGGLGTGRGGLQVQPE